LTPTVALRFFPWGRTASPGFLIRQGGGLGLMRQPVLVGLLEHPRAGRWLIDTGLHPRLAQLGWPLNLFVRLGRLELPPGPPQVGELAGLFLSHFHLDHGAGLEALQPRVLLTSREGYESSRLGGDLHLGWHQSLWPEALFERSRWLEEFARVTQGPVTGYDLFEDGSVLAVPLPGHCHGQYGLLCNTESGRVFFVADAFADSRVLTQGLKQRAPSWVAADRRAEARTQAWLRNLIHWCWIVPSHCPRAYRALGAALPPA
jgi:glyoxylase-like metal-dependent hydrolase (beta-lactamase superfamily II)